MNLAIALALKQEMIERSRRHIYDLHMDCGGDRDIDG